MISLPLASDTCKPSLSASSIDTSFPDQVDIPAAVDAGSDARENGTQVDEVNNEDYAEDAVQLA